MKLLKAPYYFVVHAYLEYTPQIFRRQVSGRKHSSFLYICRGTYRYSFASDSFTAHDGELVYLPQGGNYRYEVLDKNAKCLQIELDIAEENGECITFSDTPQIAGHFNDEEMKRVFENIKTVSDDTTSSVAAMCSVYTLILSIMKKKSGLSKKPKSKIQPAIEYINGHYTENISTKTLADLCFLSESQMRRIFSSECKCSPLVYKNRLIFDSAKKMLCTSSCAVSDIADALGFPSLYAFSRFFKRQLGVAPSEFRKRAAELDIHVK